MNKISLVFLIMLLGLFITGCSGEDVTKVSASELKDQVENITDSQDEHVLKVKKGTPNSYPNKRFGEEFEEFFSKPTWKYFEGAEENTDEISSGKSDSNEKKVDVVEFTGYCTYAGTKVKARIQFTFEDDGEEFTASYLSFNDVPQSKFMIVKLFKTIFEDDESKKEEKDSDEYNTENDVEETNDVDIDSNEQTEDNKESKNVEEYDKESKKVEEDDKDSKKEEEKNEKNDYIIEHSNTEYITKEDIQDLSKKELRLARNEIYARHGCIFKSADLNKYFNSTSWYVPIIEVGDFDSSNFNKYELANINTIKSME